MRKRLTFLVVDDQKEIVESLRDVLNDFFKDDDFFSVIIITALSGSLGVNLFEAFLDSNQPEKAPNVIISDLSMPNGIDGDEMVIRIKELGFSPSVFLYDGQTIDSPKCNFDFRFKKGESIDCIFPQIRNILLQKFYPSEMRVEKIEEIASLSASL